MDKARKDIENKFVPSGPQVVRYLSLPAEGQTKDWILAEMDRMDDYCHSLDDHGVKLHDWKDGKVSGAVYRGWFDFRPFVLGVECVGRWWTGPDELDRRRLRTLLCFQSIASGCIPNYQEDGGRSCVHVLKVGDSPHREYGTVLTLASQNVQQSHWCGDHDFWRYREYRYGD